ncbi:flagellar hook protein FlgE [Pseudooceanicola sp. C21-150M6]|uniref:flagellar hook protein FlgE n=1 Tax=Pseudooceanicola sp. C21-150M6 TaxID=3434355 RepID=UPI003D7F9606
MTISSSMNAGVAGLQVNAAKLGTIADNISNSSTYGYKRVEADFHSLVIGENSGSYTAGGVRATTKRLINERGPLVTTNNATDLAVRGRGMIPVAAAYEVENSGSFDELMLTTTGSFSPDENGYLRTDSGLVLLGWPADDSGTIPLVPRDTQDGLVPVQINPNLFQGKPTTSISLGVNLPATETEATGTGESQQLSVEYFDNLGKSESITIEFTPTIPATGASNEWTMTITDSAQDDALIGEYTVTFTDARVGGGTLASVTETTGGAYDATTGTIIVDVLGGPMEIDLGVLGGSGGLSQLSDVFAPLSISKDGSAVGNMTSIEVDANGFVHAFFDTGVKRTMYQIPLADMPNTNGLLAMDYQTYKPSPDSGAFFLWDAGDGPTGDIVAFAREESATDVAGELTDMIRTQRAYSTNAKVFQTVDEMLQETTNIKR